MWSCTRARWAMRISDELNRFEKGLCRVAGPFFCVKGKAFSGTGGTDCHDQFANWSRNDRVFARGAVQVRRRDEGTPPYGTVCRGGRPCPPAPDNATPCRAGPVCPAGCGKNLSGRCRERPLRKCILRCVGEGLCPSRGWGRTPPLRKRYKGRRKRIPQSRLRRASPL